MSELVEALRSTIEDATGTPVICLTRFHDMGLDSLEFVHMIGKIEDRFQVLFPEGSEAGFECVGDIAAALEGLHAKV
jgi:acyl carrier protein